MKGQTHLSPGLHCCTCPSSSKRLLNLHIPEAQGPGNSSAFPGPEHRKAADAQLAAENTCVLPTLQRAEAWGATLSTANTSQNWNNRSGPDSNQNSIIKGLHTTKKFQRSILSQTSFHSYQILGPEL